MRLFSGHTNNNDHRCLMCGRKKIVCAETLHDYALIYAINLVKNVKVKWHIVAYFQFCLAHYYNVLLTNRLEIILNFATPCF